MTEHNPEQLRILQLAQQAFKGQALALQQTALLQNTSEDSLQQQAFRGEAVAPQQTALFQNTSKDSLKQRSRKHHKMLQQTVNLKPSHSVPEKPYIKIVEQPTSKPMRFRYECEGRFAGTIVGRSSTTTHKTFPAIEIVGFQGRSVVVVSCVTTDPPYRPHPYNLVSKNGSKKGVYTMEINKTTMRIDFCNLGIQCVKKKDVIESLKLREEIRVDPFKTGFGHGNVMSNNDFNTVRLCFQVFIENARSGHVTEPLTPVVSDPIRNKGTLRELAIVQLCGCATTVMGNTQMMLTCEKVIREDITVRFFEENDGALVWEGFGDFTPLDVHKFVSITLKTPRYYRLDITEPVKVFVQLVRPSDGATSDPVPFKYNPINLDFKRKRQRNFDDSTYLLLRQYQQEMNQIQLMTETPSPSPQGIQNIFPLPSPAAEAPPLENTNEVVNKSFYDQSHYETGQNAFTGFPNQPTANQQVNNQNWNNDHIEWNIPPSNMHDQHPEGFENLENNHLNEHATTGLNILSHAYNDVLNIANGGPTAMDLCTENLRISDLLISS